jgi:hypothetical protein
MAAACVIFLGLVQQGLRLWCARPCMAEQALNLYGAVVLPAAVSPPFPAHSCIVYSKPFQSVTAAGAAPQGSDLMWVTQVSTVNIKQVDASACTLKVRCTASVVGWAHTACRLPITTPTLNDQSQQCMCSMARTEPITLQVCERTSHRVSGCLGAEELVVRCRWLMSWPVTE